jgi:pyruvate kinase
MIARGDLAVELPAQKIPIIQKDLIRRCIERKKLVITATQMLHTMIENPRPTRAEVSDVANAICDGTDCLMLSGETANGKYPEKAVKTMTDIAKEVEKSKIRINGLHIIEIKDEIGAFLASSAIEASHKLPLKAIICDSLTGRTPRFLSAYRGDIPLFVQCYDKRIMRELSLSFGIRSTFMERQEELPSKFINKTLKPLLNNKLIHEKDLVLVLAGSFGPKHGASFIEISKVNNLIRSN